VWLSFHPECSLDGGRITSGGLSFGATRILGAAVEVRWWITAWKVDDERCLLQVRMQLYDERVNALRAIAMASDSSTIFLDFDVLAASSLMDGQEVPDHQLFASNASVEEFSRVVGDYSKRIDRIWSFVGGLSVLGFERWRSGRFAMVMREPYGISHMVASAPPSLMRRGSWRMNSSRSSCLSGKNGYSRSRVT
jgi:hypothetical protein